MIWCGRRSILAVMILMEPRVQIERRRRFVLVECPFCLDAHDALLDGGRQKTPCGREAEAVTVEGVALGRVRGLEIEQREIRPARIV